MTSDFLLLDGAIGHILKANREIQSIATEFSLPFENSFALAAVANAVHPEIVADAHRAYVDAGADAITTNTFACTRWALRHIDREEEAIELAVAGARIARRIADTADRRVLVLGSLPPLEESYKVSGRTQLELHQPEYKDLARALSPYVDAFLCETMSTVSEALAAATAAATTSQGQPWWVSFTLRDSRQAVLRSGETLKDALEKVSKIEGMEAALVNCCAPEAVTSAMPVLSQHVPEGVRFGGYPNAFRETTSAWLLEGSSGGEEALVEPPREEYDDNGILRPAALSEHCKEWLVAGASVLGGCCGSGPQHIAELALLKQQT